VAPRLSFASVYSAAHFAKSLLWYGSEILFTFTLTEIFGLSPLAAGTTMALGLFLNAGADLAVGRILSRRIFDIKAAGCIQLAGAAASAVAFCGFGLSGFATGPARLFLIAGALSLFRLVYPVLDVPQNSLLALGAAHGGGEHRLSSLRMMMGGCANLLVAASFAPLLQQRHASVQTINFACLTAVAAVFALAGSALLYRRIQTLHPRAAPATKMPSLQRPANDFTSSSTSYLGLAGLLAAVSLAMGLFTRIEPYLSSFVIASKGQGGLTMSLIAAGSILCQPIWSRVASLRGLWVTLGWATSLWLVGAATLLWQLNTFQSSLSGVSLEVFGLIYGGGSGGVLMALWALTARVINAKSGASAKAFAVLGAAAKVGGGLSAICATLLLSIGNYHLKSGNLLSLACYAPIVSGSLCLAFCFFANKRKAIHLTN
jgi:Na+/melibiose symporter-like transporter